MFLICLAAFLTHSTSSMLIVVGEKTNRLNYEELMADVFGSAGFHSFNFFAGLVAFGAMAAYLIIVGDTVSAVLVASGYMGSLSDRASVILFFAVFVVLPVASLKDLSKLSYTSFISVMADVLLVFIVAFTGPGESR